MRVAFRETSFALDPETRTRAERCVMLALGRLQALVPSVAVSVVAAPAGPAGLAPDYEVAVHVGGARRFLVIDKDPDVVVAVGRAADRARRCLERDRTRGSLRPATAAARNRGREDLWPAAVPVGHRRRAASPGRGGTAGRDVIDSRD